MSLNVGIVGCGGIGKTHARQYQKHKDVSLKCFVDIDKARADAAAKEFGIKAYYSIAEMLKAEQLDAVSVATAGAENGGHHYEPTIQCLEAGLHVLCEKPISNEIEQGRQMVAKAKQAGKLLGIDLNHRFTPMSARAKGWIVEGKLGEGMFLNMVMWINNKNETSPYFHIKALHPHSLDIVRYFAGKVKRVQCFMSKPSTRKVCWANLSLNMEFENGMVGHLTGSYEMGMQYGIERCEYAGTKGRFVLDNMFELLTYYPREGDEMTVVKNNIFGQGASFELTFQNRIHRWVDQVIAKTPWEQVEANGDDGLAASEIIHAAIESFEGNSVVDLKGRG
ncbi:MAG: Gfo/Idh/MocA family oxidoreductase [Planctomycetota bacterium]|nr:Gfo/Idh/MocA family oxidoreductase [Planctomycetota bacterium]